MNTELVRNMEALRILLLSHRYVEHAQTVKDALDYWKSVKSDPAAPETCPRCYGDGPHAECALCKGTGYVAAKSVTEVKKQVSDILMAVVDGADRYMLDGKYVRWGRVEKDIHAVIDGSVVNV